MSNAQKNFMHLLYSIIIITFIAKICFSCRSYVDLVDLTYDSDSSDASDLPPAVVSYPATSERCAIFFSHGMLYC